MPIQHTVLLSFKPSLSKNEIDQVRRELADLQQIIPEIISFSWIENNSPENLHRGYLHGFIMEFKNDSDRKIYLEHPEHIKVAQETIIPALVDGINTALVFDYET